MKKPRFFLCFFLAFVVFMGTPYVGCLTPGGGEVEQEWLDEMVGYLKVSQANCKDPYILKAIDLTLEKYTEIKPFGVRVMQLPEGIGGVNNILCPGITVDSSVLLESRYVGMLVLVHETMHDMPPYAGHMHIDNDRILAAL